MFKFKRLLALVTIAAIVAATFPGCGSDDGGTGIEYTAPDLPPMSTFLMDFSDFGGGRYADLVADAQGWDESVTRHNWSWATSNVLVWNGLIIFGLAIPVAAFLEAFNHEPVRQPDGAWLWDYNFTVDVIHLAEFYGKIEGDEVVWEMHISREGAYTDFVWYSGRSALDGSEGTWTLNQDPDNPAPMIGIEWHMDVEAETADIKYTNIVPDGPENGGYIFYGVTGEEPYDAFYDIYNIGQDNHTMIEWDLTDEDGRVSDPNRFGDTDWHCWDTLHDDVECPASR